MMVRVLTECAVHMPTDIERQDYMFLQKLSCSAVQTWHNCVWLLNPIRRPLRRLLEPARRSTTSAGQGP